MRTGFQAVFLHPPSGSVARGISWQRPSPAALDPPAGRIKGSRSHAHKDLFGFCTAIAVCCFEQPLWCVEKPFGQRSVAGLGVSRCGTSIREQIRSRLRPFLFVFLVFSLHVTQLADCRQQCPLSPRISLCYVFDGALARFHLFAAEVAKPRNSMANRRKSDASCYGCLPLFWAMTNF